MERCLSTLDLPAAQQANVEASLNNGRATLKADGEALKAAHTQMQADLANSADKSVIGQDAINLHAAKAKMKTDAQAVHDDVLAKLSTDQQDAFNACASSHSGYHHGQAPASHYTTTVTAAPPRPGKARARAALFFSPRTKSLSTGTDAKPGRSRLRSVVP